MSETLFFLLFSIAVIAVMLVDLGVFKKAGAEEVSFREAGFWSGAWVLLAIIFYVFFVVLFFSGCTDEIFGHIHISLQLI